jgi:glucokinase
MTTINAHLALRDLGSPAHALGVPVVNLNGSSKESLLNDYLAIMRALEAANKAMAEATPHGRDFQTVPNGDWVGQKAREAFHERRALIRAMHAEFEAVAVAISEQNDNRMPTDQSERWKTLG